MNHETTNPFDDETQAFHVLVNAHDQYSLWPAFAALPAGWRSVLGPEPRKVCVDFVDAHWIDIRPLHAR
jgi:MbtH protein